MEGRADVGHTTPAGHHGVHARTVLAPEWILSVVVVENITDAAHWCKISSVLLRLNVFHVMSFVSLLFDEFSIFMITLCNRVPCVL